MMYITLQEHSLASFPRDSRTSLNIAVHPQRQAQPLCTEPPWVHQACMNSIHRVNEERVLFLFTELTDEVINGPEYDFGKVQAENLLIPVVDANLLAKSSMA